MYGQKLREKVNWVLKKIVLLKFFPFNIKNQLKIAQGVYTGLDQKTLRPVVNL